ncbi:MAG: sulfatase-like hydrolase/transferase, partial [Saccharofermentanales bacterium]
MTKRPNVLFILTDQWRGDCLGVDGNESIMTPVMDGLAESGVRFTKCYSTCPVCVPARRSILSGQYPEHHGADFNSMEPWSPDHTLPDSLRNNGYHTYFVGRDMHQEPEGKRFGYDHYLTSREYTRWMKTKVSSDYTMTEWWLDGYHYSNGPMHNTWISRPWMYDEELHMTNWVVNEGLRFLNFLRDPSCQYFLTLSFLAPHPPLTPPAFYYQRYMNLKDTYTPKIGSWEKKPAAKEVNNPSGWHADLKGETLKSCIAGYYGSINHIDDQLQRLINEVLPDLSNTIVVFTSDHGEMLGDHYMWKKSRPYEGAARVPLIIRFPESFNIPAGTIIDAPVCLEDIYPTLLEACGISVPDVIDGCSLLPLIRGEIPQVHPFIHIQHRSFYPVMEGFHALTDGKRKLIWYYDVQVNTFQYFNLEQDPSECTDCINNPIYADEIAVWKEKLIKQLQ